MLPPTQEEAIAAIERGLDAADMPGAGPELQVCLDVDGTLFSFDRKMTDRVKEAVGAHLAAGTHLIIATGRGRLGAQFILDMLPFESTILVCSNGAQTVLTGDASIPGAHPRAVTADGVHSAGHRIVNVHTFPPDVLREAVHKIRLALPGTSIAMEPVEGVRKASPGSPAERMDEPIVIRSDDELAAEPNVMRMIVLDPPRDTDDMLAALRAADIQGVDFAASGPSWLDASPAGISKAGAVEELRAELGVDPRHTVAVGDGGNDIAMLRWAHVGIAMGSARPYVLKEADLVTATVEQDGAALALEALLRR